MEEVFFDIFKEKSKNLNVKLVDDIYSDKDFASYYNMTDHSNEEEINFYLSNISYNDNVLEIGTGNGRILTPLLKKGLDICGIEPSIEMINKIIPLESREKVLNISLNDFMKSNKKIYKKIIIPATSISLFSPNEFEEFIDNYYLETPLDRFEIIFDFMDQDFFKNIDGNINQKRVDGSVFYFANFLMDDTIYFNIYLKSDETKKISYSIKHVYSIEIIEKLMKGKNFNLKVIVNQYLNKVVLSIWK